MTDSFSIRVTLAKPSPDLGEVIAKVRNIKGGHAALTRAITIGLQILTRQIGKERFNGTGPFPVANKKLGVVSGRLLRDLHSEPAESTASGYRGRIGSAVEYFGAHEMGFDGTVNVPAHRRSAYTTTRGYSVLEQSVRAHSKKMKVPRRAPLRTGIEEHSVRILGGAIHKAISAILTEGRTA